MKKITLLLLLLGSAYLNAQSALLTSSQSPSFLVPPPAAPVISPISQTICSGNAISSINITNGNGDGISNGGFETGTFSPWNINSVSPSPVISSTVIRTGSYSARLGGIPGMTDAQLFGNSSFYQTFFVPSGGATLSYWYKPYSEDTIDFDWQDAYITNSSDTVLATIMHVCSNSQTWTQVTYDLSSFVGQTIRVKFLVRGDNAGGATNMHIDDVVMTPKTNFTWTRNNAALVTGIAASGSGNVTGSLTNTTSTPITVTFSFVATNSSSSSTPTTAIVVVNPLTSETTTVSECASYTWSENGTTYTTSGIYTFLSGCVNKTLNLTINPNTSSTSNITACASYTWSLNGITYTNSGTYTYVNGCDTKTLNLTITPYTTNTTTLTSCDSFTWAVNNITYTTSGTYSYIDGCDTQILNLTIVPLITTTTTASACTTYFWSVNNTTYTDSGLYTYENGCTTQYLDLTITGVVSNTTTANACDTYTWAVNGTTYTNSGTYTYVYDCITEILDLIITPGTSNTTTVTACESYTWSLDGINHTTSGIYTIVNGCDSQILNLTINNSSTSEETQVACDNFTWNGTTYTASGDYTYTSTNSLGCDNVATLHLTITPSTTNTTTATSCGNYTWSVNGTTYSTSGTYTYLNGCNTEVLDLTINAASLPVSGNATQTLFDTDTISTIVVSPSTVIWYSSLAEALAGTNPLSPSTIVINGSTYYAVNVDGLCPSAPFAVTVTTTLSSAGFDNLNFNFYPNPTSTILNISYSKDISEVSVISSIGQVVLNTKNNSSHVLIDLSNLPSATYFVKVVSEGNEKTVKVVKK